MASTPSIPAKTSAWVSPIWPVGSGRRRVRRILASIRRSSTWFSAAADAAASAMPTVPNTRLDSGSQPSVASSMPTIAVNTISETTRGLHSSR